MYFISLPGAPARLSNPYQNADCADLCAAYRFALALKRIIASRREGSFPVILLKAFGDKFV